MYRPMLRPPPNPRAAASLADDAAFAALDELDEWPDFRLGAGQFLELLHGRLELQSRAVQQAVGAADVQDLRGSETTALQPFRIHAVRLGRTADRHDIGGHVAGHRGVVRDETMSAHLGVLMHGRQSAHDHPIAELHVAAQGGAIRHHDLVAESAVVRDVRIRHQQIVIADAGHALVVGGATVHRDRFAKYISVPDFEARRLTVVFLVLGRIAQRGELKYPVAGADSRRTVDHHMRTDPSARTDDHIRPDDAERPDLDIRRNLRLRRYHRARVDHPAAPLSLGPLVSGATMISADATSTPSTSAEP